ncbi:PAC2 family-domain-containing protein [Protomyces lactucae-debilis]|uniref:Proteasome assembly chaperone 2 n=1 Tax=Protomyces lactucae-debilis TaxID=2754530 RepID=A0A1Y2FA54_PROLT|nr:PAC2 family-domain-containing protein [Protomyces lactucae-debilis]ORY80781.1 PAC2 family-domain-containing protein [Protomyces lactucae-debilis]
MSETETKTKTETLFFPAVKQQEPISFAPILLIPTISAANVPQLATDLLIHSLSLPLLGHLDGRQLYPFAGPRESTTSASVSSTGFCTALEVYGNETLTVLHQRSPVLPHATNDFLEQVLKPFISRIGAFKHVCVLASADATFRDDAQLQTPILAFEATDGLASRLRQLSLDGLEREETDRPKLYGSGKFYRYMDAVSACQKSLGVCRFAYQGDNRSDARQLCEAALALLQVDRPTWREPPSWDTLFGPPLQIGEQGGLIW